MPSPYGAWEDSVDLTTEFLFAAALVAGAVVLVWIGRRNGLVGRPGWRAMGIGLALLAVMASMDFLDEFQDTLWVVAGIDLEPYLEDLLLPLSGVGLLVFGIVRWAPLHARLAEMETKAQAAEIERLREVDAFKTTFLNTAAHELATPLTPIRLQLDMLQDQTGKTSTTMLLNRNVDRLERLVKDLLDATRLQTGNLAFSMEPADLGELMEELDTTFTAVCADKGIRFRAERGPDLTADAVDAVRIGQLMYNLVGNAAKFTPAGGEIVLSADRDGQDIVVSVRDSGAGLDPKEIEGLFRPFTQYHRDLVGPEVGTGLGLYVSQGIAEAHGGKISVTSKGRGHGATFKVRLPVRAAHAEDPDPERVVVA